MKTSHPDHILVIDEMPLISVGLQEVFRAVNPSATVLYSENVFTALSSKEYADTAPDLVIIGSPQEHFSDNLQLAVTELKERFGHPRIMIYSGSYDPGIIGNMAVTGIDAYVHKCESIEEIKKAYLYLSKGETYISAIFHTLYYAYGQK